jgi:Pvc16 N-terminal domain
MIDTALILLRNELTNYLAARDSATVIIDNIGLFETSAGTSLPDNIVISLVNVEEESALKNQPALKRPFNGSALYRNPPVYLNLYVLFTCSYSGTGYNLALRRLAHVIQFLQSKNSFSLASSVSTTPAMITDDDIAELRFTMELYTLTFEQINHLWGSLGGRQAPFVMYKLRLIAITERAIVREVPLIEEVENIISKIPNH